VPAIKSLERPGVDVARLFPLFALAMREHTHVLPLGLGVKTMKIVRIALGLLLFGISAVRTPAAQDTRTGLENAALSYWQAFAVLPELDEKQDKIVSRWDSVELDETAIELIDKADGALSLLHRGASIERCDWGSALEQGPATLLPHLSKVRMLARFACLRARYRFQQGQSAEACQDVKDSLILARHIGAEKLLISYLVQLAVERIAMSALTPELPDLSKAQLTDLLATLKSLPPRATAADGIEGERRWLLGWVRRELSGSKQKDPKARLEFFKELLGDTPEAKRADELLSEDPEAVEKALVMCDELDVYYDQMIALLELPATELRAKWEEMNKRIQSGDNELAKVLLPGIGSVAAVEWEAEVRWAMYLAAVDIARGGDDQLQQHKDPASDEPFQFKSLPHGFELQSKLIHKDKPVVLTVGAAK